MINAEIKGIESRLKNQPRYKIGQAVMVDVKTTDEASGLRFSNMVECHISVIRASGTSVEDTYEYGVTLDMPGCYHAGKAPFKFVIEHDVWPVGKVK